MTRHRPALAMLLLVLAALYAFWFARGSEWFAVAFFALPPLLIAVSALRGGRQAGYWSGVLALVVIFAASLPGLRARFGGRR